MGATVQNQNFHHTRSLCFTKITSGTWKVRSEEGPTNACVCVLVHDCACVVAVARGSHSTLHGTRVGGNSCTETLG